VPQGPGVRDDSGVYEGSEVSIYYDPMISKFAVHGKDRDEAIERMRRALAEYNIGGIKTTLPFFREVLEDEEFVAGRIDTGFISKWQERRAKPEIKLNEKDLALIAAAIAFNSSNVSLQSTAVQPAKQPSRWAVAGRTALHGKRL
jgi:acetyl-CoA carboxylase biotin carboxylase subunit